MQSAAYYLVKRLDLCQDERRRLEIQHAKELLTTEIMHRQEILDEYNKGKYEPVDVYARTKQLRQLLIEEQEERMKQHAVTCLIRSKLF